MKELEWSSISSYIPLKKMKIHTKMKVMGQPNFILIFITSENASSRSKEHFTQIVLVAIINIFSQDQVQKCVDEIMKLFMAMKMHNANDDRFSQQSETVLLILC